MSVTSSRLPGLPWRSPAASDPYYPRYGTPQSYYSPSGYTYAPAD